MGKNLEKLAYPHHTLTTFFSEQIFKALGAELDFASLAHTINHVQTGKLQWLCKVDRASQVTAANLNKQHAFVDERLLNKAEQLQSQEIRSVLKCEQLLIGLNQYKFTTGR